MATTPSTKQLKALAALLARKADIYGPNGRIYGFEAPFRVIGDELFHGDSKLDPSALRDGHGNPIAI